MTLTVGESFTAGLLHWQLNAAQVPLNGGALWAQTPFASLTVLAEVANRLADEHQSLLALVVSDRQDDRLSLALHTPQGTFAEAISFNVTRYSLQTHQEVVAMLAMNMLRRWLNGWSPYGGHGWITVVETLD